MKIAVIGLGAMGAAVARHLLSRGHEVRGVDLRPAALEALRAAGGRADASIAAAVGGADAAIDRPRQIRDLQRLRVVAFITRRLGRRRIDVRKRPGASRHPRRIGSATRRRRQAGLPGVVRRRRVIARDRVERRSFGPLGQTQRSTLRACARDPDQTLRHRPVALAALARQGRRGPAGVRHRPCLVRQRTFVVVRRHRLARRRGQFASDTSPPSTRPARLGRCPARNRRCTPRGALGPTRRKGLVGRDRRRLDIAL